MENTIGYRDQHLTHIPWMPRIPAHWACYRLKSKVDNLIAPLESHVEDDLKYIALEHIESWTGKVKYTNLSSGNSSQLKRFEKNDVLFSKLRPYLAKVVFVQERGGCVGELLVLRSKNSNELYQNYLAHFLRAKPIIDAIDGSTFGAKMPRASWDFIGNLILPLPPPDEQEAIVKYLDHMTRRIDKAIRAKKKLIQLLNEQKQVIIHQAVTKGLDPDVPMKDSGVPWLGEVPEHWEVRKLKHLVKGKLTYGANEAALHTNPEWPRYIRITDFGYDGKLRDSTFRSLPPEVAKPYLVLAGDILFARSGATVGKAFLVHDEVDNACHAGYLIRARPNPGFILPYFLFRYVQSKSFEAWKDSIFNTATIQNIGADKYSNLFLPKPPVTEQTQILKRIDEFIFPIDDAINKGYKVIDLLSEYRTRLIADVVTGQVDVREIAAQLPDEQEDVEPFELDDVEEEILETEQDE